MSDDTFDRRKRKRGFTLIEMSIVLMIIGLVIGSILGGQILINNAHKKKLISELNALTAAVHTFTVKYDALPGNFRDAYSVIGSAGGCTNIHVNTDTNGCNGDGNGSIQTDQEEVRAWQYLAHTRLIPGRYSGTLSGATYFIAGVNAPVAAYPGDNAVWGILNGTSFAGTSVFGNMFLLHSQSYGSPIKSTPSILTGSDAYDIDNKIDDGIASRGKVMAQHGIELPHGSGTCYLGTYGQHTYNTTGTVVSCKMGFFFIQ